MQRIDQILREFGRRFLAVAAGCLLTGSLIAQDVHFSQWQTTPMRINPAMTGVFDGTVRFSNNYRSQWSSLGKGYKTIHASLDAPIGKGKLNNGSFFGGGLLVIQDKAGSAELTSTYIEGSLSYTMAMDDAGDHWFSLGFQGGLNQLSLDLTKTTWDAQWNGDKFDPALPSMESIQLQQFAYLDFHAGFMYYFVPNEYNAFNAGASMAHIGSPNISYFVDGEDALPSRYTIHSSGLLSMNRDNFLFFEPRLLGQLQGKQLEVVGGGLLRNKLQFKSRYTNYRKEMYFSFGGYYRFKDAIIAAARFEFKSQKSAFGLGVSYDFGTSRLARLAGSANSFEINLSIAGLVPRGQRGSQFNKMPLFF